jgi:elongation factor P
MSQVATNEFKAGIKVEIEGQPYVIIHNEFVKPGKGQPFNRIKVKNLLTSRVVERTYKSGEKLDLADIVDSHLRLLYTEQDGAVFMNDESFEQVTVSYDIIGDNRQWLKDDIVYALVFYKDVPISVEPPTFMDLKITETVVGLRGDTSGRVMKPATLETGAKIQVPIFIEEGELIKVDTRENPGAYVGRVNN